MATTSKKKPRTVNDKFEPMDMKSAKKKLEDIFISGISCWSPPRVRAAIDSFDNGQFQQAGLLVDSMTKDGRIQSCINTLVFGILGLPFEWKWSVPDADSGQIDTQENDQYQPTDKDLEYLAIFKRGFWSEFMETSTLSGVMKNIINMGLSVIGKSWTSGYIDGYEDKVWLPEIYVFHPSNIWYNTWNKKYWVTTQYHGVIEIDETDERFQIIKHVDEQRPWMNGAVRSVSWLWLDKWTSLVDWRAFSSVYGNPIRMLTTIREDSTRPDDSDIEQFLVNLSIGQQYGQPVQLPEGHKLELLQAEGSSIDVFQKKIEDTNKEIAIAYLGQNLTSDVQSGSHAAAEVHHKVLQDYIEAYATTLNRALREIVRQFYNYNFPSDVRVPVPYFQPDAPVDELNTAKTKEIGAKALNEVADALTKLSLLQVDGKNVLTSENMKDILGRFMFQ